MVIWNIIRMWSYQFFYQKIRPHRKIIKIIFFGSQLLIPIIAIISQNIVYTAYSPLTSFFYTFSMWTLGALGYLLMGSTLAWSIAWILYIVRVITGKKRFTWNRFFVPFSVDTRLFIRTVITLPIIIALSVIVYGTINTQSVRTVHYSISNQKLATPFPENWVGQKIAVFSDTHTGQIRKRTITEKAIRAINDEQPIITFMVGDLVDGPKFPIIFLEPLTKLQSPLGNYFIPGNHEKYSKDSEVESMIGKYITLIADEVKIIDNVAILGIDYHKGDPIKTFEQVEQLTNTIPEGTPIIGILHDPKYIQTLLDHQPNLTLSGHTHGGQMWPGNILVNLIYKEFAYGPSLHNDGKSVHITTSGIGTALVPMRVGTKPEVVIIHIEE